MIYFKDQSQKYPIKEEPSSPAENWKEDGETSMYITNFTIFFGALLQFNLQETNLKGYKYYWLPGNILLKV